MSNISEAFVYRVGPVMGGAGVSLCGDFFIGEWGPTRGAHYINGVADAKEIAGPFASRVEAEAELERMKGGKR